MSGARTESDLSRLEQHLANRFDPGARGHDRFAGIIGDRPSQYAKSPVLWNAAFKGLGLNAVFLPFDVDEPRLRDVVRALRQSESLLGFSVTVPYKIKVLDLLDELDPKAAKIGAVNTVARTDDGRLVGYNTDGSGFLASLTAAVIEPPLTAGPLAGLDALLIGGGGAARAVAFYLAEYIAPGRLFIANRTRATAEELARAVDDAYGNGVAIGEDEIERVAPRVALVVNSSTKGQAGLRTLADGSVTSLEPYSALAAASPALFPVGPGADSAEARQRWFAASVADVKENNRKSLELAARLPPTTAVYDVVYAPVETVALRHARYSGHRVANGKGMNIAQAVDGFCDRLCTAYLREAGLDAVAARRHVTAEMARVW